MLAETAQTGAQPAAIPVRPQTAAAELREVSKVYGTFAALRNVSVDFPPGSCTMILGENGAGKSTLLRVIAGLLEPSRGSVTTFGTAPQDQRGRIAYMSHAPMLYDELSAMENLLYFAGLGGASCGACGGSPEMALRAVGLDPHLKRPVGQYSQGMRQRTSLARVLQSDPELLLLDEPFSNLDVESAQMMVKLLADFRTWPIMPRSFADPSAGPSAEVGKRTIILTTHQAHLGEPLADRTLTMRTGKIASSLQRGTAA